MLPVELRCKTLLCMVGKFRSLIGIVDKLAHRFCKRQIGRAHV